MPAPRGQRQQSFFCREGKRQPGAGHLLGIQRVKKEEHGQPPLGRAGKKCSVSRMLWRSFMGTAPSCYDMHAAGGSIPLIRPAEYTPLSYRTSPNFARKQEKSVCPCALRARVIKYPCCGNLFSSPVLFREEPVWKTVHFRSLAAMCSTTAPCRAAAAGSISIAAAHPRRGRAVGPACGRRGGGRHEKTGPCSLAPHTTSTGSSC